MKYYRRGLLNGKSVCRLNASMFMISNLSENKLARDPSWFCILTSCEYNKSSICCSKFKLEEYSYIYCTDKLWRIPEGCLLQFKDDKEYLAACIINDILDN